MDVLAGLLLLPWLGCAISESFTAALVLLVSGGEVTTEDLELVEYLIRALEANEDLTEMVLISEVSGVNAG